MQKRQSGSGCDSEDPLVAHISRTHADELADRRDSGGPEKLAELAQLLRLVRPGAQHGNDESALGLRTGRGVRLVVGHTPIMTGIGR